jgi:hypothetical protein
MSCAGCTRRSAAVMCQRFWLPSPMRLKVRRGSAGELFEYFHFRFGEILATRGDQDRPPRVPRLALRDIAEKGERLAHAD